MATYLISTMPADGHVTPALSVAASLAARGHRVLWHTGEDYRETVEAVGAVLTPMVHTPNLVDLPPTADPGTSGVAEAVSALRRLLVDRMTGQLADYEQILSGTDVDAVLVDLCALGGRVLHERTGIPWVTMGISPLSMPAPEIPPFGSGRQPPRSAVGRAANAAYWRLGRHLMRGLTIAYDEQRRHLGLPPLPRGTTTFDHMFSDQLHLQASTPGLEFPRRHWPNQVRLVGPLLPPPPPNSPVPPPWWDDVEAATRVVHVTQGSVATDPSDLTLPAIRGLTGSDVLVVVTTPHTERLGDLPSNVRVARHVPHSLLMPMVDAVITNAGYNGVKSALGHAVPLVMAPWGNDQPDVAARVTRLGAGIDLRTPHPAPATVRAAVDTVLDDERYRQAAERIRLEFSRFPGGEAAADALEAFTSQTIRPGVHHDRAPHD